MKLLGKVCCLCLLYGISTTVSAQDLPPQPESQKAGHSLPTLVEMALQNNPTIQQTLADVSRAKGMRWHNTRKPNPGFGYTGGEIGNDGKAGQQGVYFSQEFITANKLGLNDQIGGWEVQQLSWQWQTQELQVSGEVRQRFYDVLASRRRVDVLRQLNQILQDGVKTTQRLIEAGEIGKGQLLQAQLEFQQNELTLNNELKSYAAAERALAVVIGLPQDNLSIISGSLGGTLPQLENESAWQQILTGHPLIESARAEVTRHQWNVQRERAEPISNIQSQFSIQYDDSTNDTVTGLQLGLTLPVHNQNSGKISAASADYMRACHEIQRRELQLKQSYVQTYRQYEIAMATNNRIQEKLLPLAKENLETTKEIYQIGESSYVNLLTAQRAYVDILMQLVTARRDAWKAVALIESKLMTDALGATN